MVIPMSGIRARKVHISTNVLTMCLYVPIGCRYDLHLIICSLKVMNHREMNLLSIEASAEVNTNKANLPSFGISALVILSMLALCVSQCIVSRVRCNTIIIDICEVILFCVACPVQSHTLVASLLPYTYCTAVCCMCKFLVILYGWCGRDE